MGPHRPDDGPSASHGTTLKAAKKKMDFWSKKPNNLTQPEMFPSRER
jgi:hypothetical protein